MVTLIKFTGWSVMCYSKWRIKSRHTVDPKWFPQSFNVQPLCGLLLNVGCHADRRQEWACLISGTRGPEGCPKWGKFCPLAGGTRRLFSMLHPKQVLVLICPTSLPVTVPRVPIVTPWAVVFGFCTGEDGWGVLLSCMFHIVLADFMPLFFSTHKLDSMFLGLPQPLHWAALEKEPQKRLLTKDSSDSLAEK